MAEKKITKTTAKSAPKATKAVKTTKAPVTKKVTEKKEIKKVVAKVVKAPTKKVEAKVATKKVVTKIAEPIAVIRETVLEPVKVIKAKTETEKKVKATAGDDGRFYATGKRKNAIARVWLKRGTGKIIVNGKPAEKYLGRKILNVMINQPFVVTDNVGKCDIVATVLGGGLSGQAGAIRLGISKTLDKFDTMAHSILRKGGFLTRDSRVVERKKSGLKKARKAPTYRKR